MLYVESVMVPGYSIRFKIILVDYVEIMNQYLSPMSRPSLGQGS